MLHIFADALLIAMRMEPLHPTADHARAHPKIEHKSARRWFGLIRRNG